MMLVDSHDVVLVKDDSGTDQCLPFSGKTKGNSAVFYISACGFFFFLSHASFSLLLLACCRRVLITVL